MALHAEAVGILIEKGRFEPEVALGIAEAIEVSLMHAQFVTVPILDARLQTLKAETSVSLMSLESKLSASIQELKTELKTEAERTKTDLKTEAERTRTELKTEAERTRTELKTEMEKTKAEVVRWVFLAMLGSMALSAGATVVVNAFK
jgi:regulator of protease activity HflC (stomatin/prohibitin superfamily)